MNRTSDFWAAIQWMYFKRIQQWGLIFVPWVRILLLFEAWWLRKNVTLRFHLFPRKNVLLISGKGNISLLLICISQAWKWAFKQHIFGSVLPENHFVLQITTQLAAGSENGGDMSSVTSEWICSHLRGGSPFVNEKKIIWSDLFPTDR